MFRSERLTSGATAVQNGSVGPPPDWLARPALAPRDWQPGDPVPKLRWFALLGVLIADAVSLVAVSPHVLHGFLWGAAAFFAVLALLVAVLPQRC
jgi:hypothetical protein